MVSLKTLGGLAIAGLTTAYWVVVSYATAFDGLDNIIEHAEQGNVPAKVAIGALFFPLAGYALLESINRYYSKHQKKTKPGDGEKELF